MTTSQIRVQSGTPDGGQFAAAPRAEPGVTLAGPAHISERLTVPDEAPPRVREVAAAVAQMLPPTWSGRAEIDPELASSLHGGWSIEVTRDDESAWASVEVSTWDGDPYVTALVYDEDPGRRNTSLSTPNVERALAPLRAHLTRWA